ncbi:MAG TPA: HAD family phosphatase [Candidatus Cloacimonetes bacterium]|nr:HAD family phosphatase [Candidatus Cloacimonadota bacterium]
MKFKAVIFDLDGTLIDSMGIWTQVDVEFLQRRNISVPDDLFKDMKEGNSFIEVAEYFIRKFDLPDSPREIMDEWTEMVAEHYRKDVKLKHGAKEFLDFLKQNKIKMGIGTSNNEYLTRIVLEANGISEYFESIVIGKEEIKGKPFPDIFLKAAAELDVEPNDCLVIEDVLVGVQAAKNAGMTVYAIYDEFSEPDKNEIKRIADRYVGNFNQIWKQGIYS